MESLSTLAFKILIWVLASAIKICTRLSLALIHVSVSALYPPSYSSELFIAVMLDFRLGSIALFIWRTNSFDGKIEALLKWWINTFCWIWGLWCYPLTQLYERPSSLILLTNKVSLRTPTLFNSLLGNLWIWPILEIRWKHVSPKPLIPRVTL